MNGRCRTPEYKVWAEMIRRCTVATCRGYRWYGARGIAVCDRWLASFDAFLEDMGKRPEGKTSGGVAIYTIERNDNDGPYAPHNCRWATRLEQATNMRPPTPPLLPKRRAWITRKQYAVLQFIGSGARPSYASIARVVGSRCPTSAFHLLRELNRRGLIGQIHKGPGSRVVTPLGLRLLASSSSLANARLILEAA